MHRRRVFLVRSRADFATLPSVTRSLCRNPSGRPLARTVFPGGWGGGAFAPSRPKTPGKRPPAPPTIAFAGHILWDPKGPRKPLGSVGRSSVRGVLLNNSASPGGGDLRGNVSAPGIFCDPCPTGGLLPLICGQHYMDLPLGPRDISRCFDLGWVWTLSYPR